MIIIFLVLLIKSFVRFFYMTFVTKVYYLLRGKSVTF